MNDLRKYIIETMRVQPNIDPAAEIRTRVDFLKDCLLRSGRTSYVLGISGGQDSALVGKLAQIAVDELRSETGNEDYAFIAVLLPYGVQKDGADAVEAANDFIKADKVFEFNIKNSVDAFENEFNLTSMPGLADYHKGNMKARVRMTAQYAYAGQYDGMVLGTDHSAENLSGFFTLHGDGAADIVPIFGLNKRQGAALLRELESPEKFYTKAPTADLLDNKPQQSDEVELGVTYKEIDDYLEGRYVSDSVSGKIEKRFIATEFKRHPALNIYYK